MHWAAYNDRLDIARYLINKGAQIDVGGGELQATPLNWAARSGRLKMVAFLLSQNADPTLYDIEGLFNQRIH